MKSPWAIPNDPRIFEGDYEHAMDTLFMSFDRTREELEAQTAEYERVRDDERA